MDSSFSLLSLCLIFLRQKRRILTHFVAVVALSVGFSYLIPKNYKATTLFLPPFGESSSALGLAGSLGLGFSLDLGGQSPFTSQQIETLFLSRRITEATIRKFDLIHVYKTHRLPNKTEKAIERLKGNMKLRASTESALTQKVVTDYSLSIVDKDGRRAADIANFMVAELGRAMDQVSRSQFSYTVDFIGGRLDSVANAKKDIQRRLAVFQKENKVYSPELKEQVLASIDMYAELRKERIMVEMERDLMLFDRDKGSREVRLAEKRIADLDKRLKGIEGGTKADVMPGLDFSVDIAYEYMDLVQEAEVLMKLELLLRQQFEEARIRSARVPPSVRVIDPAVPPEWKNSPKKAFIVLGITVVYMTGLFIWILLAHGVARAPESTRAKLREFRNALRFRAK